MYVLYLQSVYSLLILGAHKRYAVILFICMLNLYANTLNKFGTFSKCNDKMYASHSSLHECTNAQMPGEMQHMKFTKTPNKPKLKQTNVSEKATVKIVDIPKIATVNSKCILFKTQNIINIVACLNTKQSVRAQCAVKSNRIKEISLIH